MALHQKPKLKKLRSLLTKSSAWTLAVLLSAGVGVSMTTPAFANGNSGNTNSASYWEGQLGHSASCYKHEGNSEHGKVTNGGTAVTLATFNQSWPGDHWEALIVNGGSVDNGSGPGNVVYTHPSAGTPYFTPLNAGGQQSGVSHWIVCKGTTPTPPPLVASATIQVAPATCEVGEVASVGTMVNATLTSSSGTTGPGTYSFLFGANQHAKFAGNQSTLTLTGSLAGPKTDGECGPPEIPKDAVASVTVTPATCDSAGVANFDVTNASWDGPAVLKDGVYTRTATADAGHEFSDGTTSAKVTYQLEDILNPNAPPCYTPPTVVTPVIEFTPGTCQVAGVVSAVETDTYSWTVTGPQSARVYTAVAKGNVTLTQSVFGPYDMRLINSNADVCQPEFIIEQACKYVKITYVNNSKWDRWPDTRYSGDGVTGVDYGSGLTYTNVKVAAGASKVIFEKTFDEDYNDGEVSVWYQDILGAERDIDTAAVELKVTTDCEPNQVTGNAYIDVVQYCGGINFTFNHPAEVGENEFVEPVDFHYTDENGDVQTVTMEANDAPVVRTVTFGEDTGEHEVDVWIGNDEPLTITIQTDCEPTLVTEVAVPKATDVCGTTHDKLNIPKDTDEVSYKITKDTRVNGVGSVTVEAVAADGHQFKDGLVTSWTFKFTNKPCPASVPPAGTGLDEAGVSSANSGLGLTGIALLAAGLFFGALALKRKRRAIQ